MGAVLLVSSLLNLSMCEVILYRDSEYEIYNDRNIMKDGQ